MPLSDHKPLVWYLVSDLEIPTAIAFPVAAHALLAAVVVYINQQISSNFSLPSSIVSFLGRLSVSR